jgi:hypothetical protein
MANPYSYDLRQKVINAIEMDGMKKREASRLRLKFAHSCFLLKMLSTLSEQQLVQG